MTTHRDFDRLARAWLELGPDEAPERTVVAILQATEVVPQVRRGFRWPAWRDLRMSRTPLLIAVWATVLVAVAGIAVLGRANEHGTVAPARTPSSSSSGPPTSAAPAVTIDPRLIGQWIGGHRPTLGISAGGGARLIVSNGGASSITLANEPGRQYLPSTFSTDSEILRMKSDADPAGACASGDSGTYLWSMSASGRILTIAAGRDDCDARPAAMIGAWWQIGCHDVVEGCLGDLDPGTYESSSLRFRADPPNRYPSVYGNLTYAVPDDWANSADLDGLFGLMPSDEFENVDQGIEQAHREIVVFAHPAVAAQDAACSGATETGVEQSAAGMIRAITKLGGVTVSSATPVSIGGLSGQMIDVSLSPSWAGICPDRTKPSVPVLNEAGTGDHRWSSVLSSGEWWRLIIVELGDGNLAAIVIDNSESPSSFDEFAAEAMPIVQSLRFK